MIYLLTTKHHNGQETAQAQVGGSSLIFTQAGNQHTCNEEYNNKYKLKYTN